MNGMWTLAKLSSLAVQCRVPHVYETAGSNRRRNRKEGDPPSTVEPRLRSAPRWLLPGRPRAHRENDGSPVFIDQPLAQVSPHGRRSERKRRQDSQTDRQRMEGSRQHLYMPCFEYGDHESYWFMTKARALLCEICDMQCWMPIIFVSFNLFHGKSWYFFKKWKGTDAAGGVRVGAMNTVVKWERKARYGVELKLQGWTDTLLNWVFEILYMNL